MTLLPDARVRLIAVVASLLLTASCSGGQDSVRAEATKETVTRAQLGSAPADQVCEVPGDWPRSAEARWLRARLEGSGYTYLGCTGSAFEFEVQRGKAAGRNLTVWSTPPTRDLKALRAGGFRRIAEVDGVAVSSDGIRAVWMTHARTVWARGGQSAESYAPPRLPVLARLVRSAAD